MSTSALVEQASARGLVLPTSCGGATQESLGDVLPNVALSLAAGLGCDLGSGFSGGSATALDLDPSSRTCVVLVDGLGHRNLAERAGHVPTLRSALRRARSLRTTYPSTTAAAVASFGTGAPPGATGMLGYTIRRPGSGESASLANLVQWSQMPPPEQWQRVPTVFQRLEAAGVPVHSVGPARFSGSGMTAASLRGGVFVDAESLAARVDATLATLASDGLVYLYWGDVDKTGHHHGWQSRQWGDELEHLDRELCRLVRGAPRGTRVLLVADHGMVDVDRSHRWDVAQEPALRDEVALVAGEPRALQVHLTPGADITAAADRWRDVLGEAGLVLTGDQAVAGGLFGAVADHVSEVIGDLVVAMTGRATVVDSRTQTPASLELVGVHGSLTEPEMQVPMLRWDC